MPIDFPNSATPNQTYTVGATTWTYDGEKWVISASGRTGPSAVVVSDTSPTVTGSGTLWFNPTNGKTYAYYTDADSSQWVEVGNADPTFNTLTTKGDILTRSSSAMTRQAIGADGQVLTADSTQTNGMKWGGTPGIELITSVGCSSGGTAANGVVTVGSGVSSVTITNAFSSSYDNYRITWDNGVASGSTNMGIQLGSTTTGYYNALIQVTVGTNALASGARNGTETSFDWCGYATTTSCYFDVALNAPNLAKNTFTKSSLFNPSGSIILGEVTGFLANTTQYTSFVIKPTSAVTMTGGTIRVYGYRNSI